MAETVGDWDRLWSLDSKDALALKLANVPKSSSYCGVFNTYQCHGPTVLTWLWYPIPQIYLKIGWSAPKNHSVNDRVGEYRLLGSSECRNRRELSWGPRRRYGPLAYAKIVYHGFLGMVVGPYVVAQIENVGTGTFRTPPFQEQHI